MKNTKKDNREIKILTKNQYEILVRLDDEYAYGFYHFSDLGLTKKQLSAEFKVLREEGLVKFCRGLMNDDGEVCGSGYTIPYHSKAFDLIKECESL